LIKNVTLAALYMSCDGARPFFGSVIAVRHAYRINIILPNTDEIEADSVLNSSNRDGEKGDERDRSEEDNQPKPQFRDECFRKMDLMIELLVPFLVFNNCCLMKVALNVTVFESTNLRNPRHCPSGVYVMPSADNFYIWYGVLFIHKGYYKGGVFKFKLNIPTEYPFYDGKYPPTVHFISKLINDDGLFHPLIHPETGNFSLTQQFKDWASHKYYIFHVLHYVKKSFKKDVLDKLSEKHCLNKAAYDTYRENPKKFGIMAKQCAELSTSDTVLYDNHNESNPIQFSKLSDEKLEELKSFISPPATERERPNYTSRRTYSSASNFDYS
ncbi:8994_t:CDS:2, partial [Racocetra persica]